MLLGRTGLQHELHVAARPAARRNLESFRNSGCALALARRVGLLCRDLLSFPLSLSIPATLRLAAHFALRTGAILLRRTPPPPAAGCLPALRTAVARLRARGLKPALTPLQQTPPAARRPPIRCAALPLTTARSAITLKRVHGICFPTDQVSGRSSILLPEALSLLHHPLQSTRSLPPRHPRSAHQQWANTAIHDARFGPAGTANVV
jgi:hypothetical protein